MKGNILIIEDDREIGDLISIYLRKEGISVTHVISGEEGIEQLYAGRYDLLVLDLNLPGLDGYEVLQKIRRDLDIPVIIVSARIDDEDKILGFGYGADDFVVKPFSPKVLSARIRAHLRRETRTKTSGKSNIFRFGSFTLDSENKVLKKDNERIALSPMEMDLLCTIASEQGNTVSQEDLYKKVWGNSYGDMTTVSVHIQRLRKKIETDPSSPQYIKTVYGYGYMLEKGGNR